MKIKEVQDNVANYFDLNSLADAVQNGRKFKVFNAEDSDLDTIFNDTISKHQRETELQSGQSTKPIRAELITFGAELFNKLKENLLDITETDQSSNPQPDVIVLQSSRTNTKATLQSSKAEHAEPRRIEDIYKDIFINASHINETIATFVDDTQAPVGDVRAPAKYFADMDSEGKKIMSGVESTNTSNDSMCFIKKNSEDDLETDKELYTDTKILETKQSIHKLFKSQQFEEEAVKLLGKKFVGLQTALPHTHSVKFCEKVARQDLEEVNERDNNSAGDNLETLSNLTYNKHREYHSETNVVKAKGHDVTQHTAPSFAINRKSKASKRKDVLHNFEVLKTLLFDDESFSEESLNVCSPLKRTVCGETAYMRKTKECVITRHDKNVSKQNNELIVESQGRLDSELYFKSGSNLDFDKLTSATSTEASKLSKSESLRKLVSFYRNLSQFDDIYSKSAYLDTHTPVKKPSQMLIFDYLNPLNNIMLRPFNVTEAHKYNPMKAGEKICYPKQNQRIEHCNHVSKHYASRSRSRHFYVRSATIKQQRFKPKTAQAADQRLRFSTTYSGDTKRPNAERDNITKLPKYPLQNRFSSNSNAYLAKSKKRISSLSTDKHRYHRSVKVTPIPKTKRPKISITPNVQFKVPEEVSLADESLHSLPQKKSTNPSDHSLKTRAKKLPKTKATVNSDSKLEDDLFLQQLIADYIGFYDNNNDDDNKLQDDINLNVDPKSESFMAFSQSTLSFSSSKNLNPKKSILSTSKQSTMQATPYEPPPPEVLLFDYLNSLNNVLLAPIDKLRKTEETTCGFEHSHSIVIHNKQEDRNDFARDFEVRTVSIKQQPVVAKSTPMKQDQRSRFLQPHSVNTEEQATKIDQMKNKPKIFLQDYHSSHSNAKITRGKKCIRNSSAGKDRHLSFIGVDPKPITKMQNISSIPKVKIKMPVEPPSHKHELTHSMLPKKADTKNSDRNALRSKTRGKRSSKTLSFLTKVAQSKTAEQFIIDYSGGFSLKPNDYEKHSLDDVNSDKSIKAISQSGATFTLSKNLNPTKDFSTTSNTDRRSHHQFAMQVTPSQVDWPPELMCTASSMKYDSDFGANVVAKINMLPFMGSQECDWETSLDDTWSFRLLNGRLRLTARLAHRVHNETRTRVRGDTPVLDITVAAVQFDRVDLVARLCARFACGSLRPIVLRAVRRKCYASDIPPLLRRCTDVVRIALHWKRAMYDAKARLAYTLDKYGNLSMKVANIPARSVWEVKMSIGLVSDHDSLVPSPRATSVRVLPIVSDVLVPAADVRSVLVHTPKDWGHVPSTLWRVYRLLKHKKRDDDLIA